MANETTLTLVGNLTADPELRHTQAGLPVANFGVACTARNLNRDSGEWDDQPTVFWRVTVWRDQAKHVAESLRKGVQVIVVGHAVQTSWPDKDTGKQRSSIEVVASHVGPALQFATATVSRTGRSGDGLPGDPAARKQPVAAGAPF